MSNLDLKTAAQKISASLRYARSQAAAEKKIYVALFDFDDNRLVIINSALTMADFKLNNQETIEEILKEHLDKEQARPAGFGIYNPPDGVRIEKGVSREGDFFSGFFPVFFFPSGGSSGGEITVANQRGRHYTVNIDFITGTVRLLREKC